MNFDHKLGAPVDLVFAIFTPKSLDPPNRLQLVSKLSRMLKKSTIRNAIKGANKAEDLIALLITVFQFSFILSLSAARRRLRAKVRAFAADSLNE